MSYKHNDLMAMRLRYWQENSESVAQDKQQLKFFLQQQGLFKEVTEYELQYFFFSLPSSVVMKAHAFGFAHKNVTALMQTHIQLNAEQLKNKQQIAIKYRM